MCRWLIASLLLHSGGCHSSGAPASEEAAREALNLALEAWKTGRTADEMRRATPEVIVGDEDWKLGHRLVEYEIGDGLFDGKNLRVPVTLTVAQPPRGKHTRVVNYIIGTQPVVTIFRDGE